MLHKTRGIVFRTIPYSDSSLIVHVYTDQFGLRSYLVSGVHGKKSKMKASLFLPLALVEMNVSNRERSSMHRISEITPLYAWKTIHADMRKSAVLLFLNEMLYKSIREEEPNPDLFDFISHALQILDLSSESCANFHLVFLSQLAGLLGFSPQGSFSEDTPFFNLAEGHFQSHAPSHNHFMAGGAAKAFSDTIDCNFETSHLVTMPSNTRSELLRKLIEFYQLHISTVKEIKSHTVLEEVLS
jgi:DNA repair protein RecO (recombination protein O)